MAVVGCMPADGLDFPVTAGEAQTLLVVREACGGHRGQNRCETEWRMFQFSTSVVRSVDSEDAHVMFFLGYPGEPESNCLVVRDLDDWQQTESELDRGWELPTPVLSAMWSRGEGSAEPVPWEDIWRYGLRLRCEDWNRAACPDDPYPGDDVEATARCP